MKALFYKLFDIREGEAFKTLLMFAFIFLLTASLLVVKPVRTSLFLVKFGVNKLPLAYILVALFSIVVASLYSRYSRRFRLYHLTLITLLASIFCLWVFWLMLYSGYQGHWYLYALYIWVDIFGVITATQFWLSANYIFNAREARRLFGFIGAGAISGAIFGGYLANYLAPRIKTENLIFFSMGFLIICIFLVWMIWQKSADQSARERSLRQKREASTGIHDNPAQLILKSRHLLYLTLIIGVSVVVANLVDYQFSAVARKEITDADRLTAFFGFWISTLSVLSLGIQLFLTGRTIKHLGVTISLFFLPLGLLIGAVLVFISPALWSAITIKVSEGSLKHSINRSGTELLALPIPLHIKNKAKAFIDIFIRNFAQGFGGIVLIILTAGLGFSIQSISLIILGLIAVWIYMIVKIKDEYIYSFRAAIEKRTIQIEEQPVNLEDAFIFETLMRTLDGENERQILYVLHLLEDSKIEELSPYLKKLIEHPSNRIKACVLRLALRYEELDLKEEAQTLIESQDQCVQFEALHYTYMISKEKIRMLRAYLNHNDYRVRLAALMCASKEWKRNREFRNEIEMKGLINSMFKNLRKMDDEPQKQGLKISTAEIIGESNNPELYPYLHMLLNDKSLDVVKAAIISIKKILADEFVSILVAHLGTRRIRGHVKECLAQYGERVIDTLAKHLENPHLERRKRTAIPGILALIGSQKSVNLLSVHLNLKDSHLRYEIIRALFKLRETYPLLKFESKRVEENVLEETAQYMKLMTLWLSIMNASSEGEKIKHIQPHSNPARKAKALLALALMEKLDEMLERTFRLLGLKYTPKDMLNAYLGLKSNRHNLRANAIEFLDNILRADLKKTLIPMVEIPLADPRLIGNQKYCGLSVSNEFESIAKLLQGDDAWLKACSVYFLAIVGDERFIPFIKRLEEAQEPIVKETAKFYLKKVYGSN
jgi:AAA family ATP:ADP antiporter